MSESPEQKRARLDAEDLEYERWCEAQGLDPRTPHWDEFWSSKETNA